MKDREIKIHTQTNKQKRKKEWKAISDETLYIH